MSDEVVGGCCITGCGGLVEVSAAIRDAMVRGLCTVQAGGRNSEVGVKADAWTDARMHKALLRMQSYTQAER